MACSHVQDRQSAVPSLDRAIGIAEAHYGPSHPDLAEMLAQKAKVLREGRYDTRPATAISLYERAVAMLEPYSQDWRLAHTLSELPTAYREKGWSDRALKHGLRALELGESSMADHPLYMASACLHLARIYDDLRKFDQALDLTVRARALYLKKHPPGHDRIKAVDAAIRRLQKKLDIRSQARPWEVETTASAKPRDGVARRPTVNAGKSESKVPVRGATSASNSPVFRAAASSSATGGVSPSASPAANRAGRAKLDSSTSASGSRTPPIERSAKRKA